MENEKKPYAQLRSSPLVSISVLDQVLSGRFDNLDKKGRAHAARLYFLAAMFPTMPAGVLKSLAAGDGDATLARTEDGFDLFVHDKTLIHDETLIPHEHRKEDSREE